jgi:hypothetical protein
MYEVRKLFEGGGFQVCVGRCKEGHLHMFYLLLMMVELKVFK